MIATTAFGDVVKEAREIGNLRLRQVLHDRATRRVFVIETAQ